MAESSLESILFPFEDVAPDLDRVPIAARRALDRAGLRLSLESWRSLPYHERKGIAQAGASDIVDIQGVIASAKTARPSPQRIEPSRDPDPLLPPDALVAALGPSRPLDPRAWMRLRALDRYALAHEHRRGLARNDPDRLGAAADRILIPAPSSSRPPPSRPRGETSAGRYSEAPEPASSRRGASSPPAAPEDPTSVSTHLTRRGDVHMVDVGEKAPTRRRAVAAGKVSMRPETASRVLRGEAAKGEVLATARLAGIMAAKRTPDLIPLCHSLALTRVDVAIDIDPATGVASVTATVEATDRTGVEMEALVATSAACLTIYDMLKGVDRDMTILEIKLLEKTGGKSGDYRRSDP